MTAAESKAINAVHKNAASRFTRKVKRPAALVLFNAC